MGEFLFGDHFGVVHGQGENCVAETATDVF
jgi:hypothetical protein